MSCEKGILDEKPSSTYVVPKTIDDLDRLLNNSNIAFCYSPVTGQLSSDDYFVSNLAAFQSFSSFEYVRNCYIWKSDIFGVQTEIADWNRPYSQIFYCNNILEVLADIPITDANRQQWNNVSGTAHFFRAYAFYNLASIFCKAYDSATAASSLGVPLKLTSQLIEKVERASLQDTYKQILSDLKVAEDNINLRIDVKRLNRPCIESVYALYARIYLSMRDYPKAGYYANKCLELRSSLLDYSKLNKNASNPFPVITQAENPEILYYDRFDVSGLISRFNSSIRIDSSLYSSYEEGDLRPILYFMLLTDNQYGIKASYTGSFDMFTGLGVDEMFLIRAECLARAGETSLAIDDLNHLLKSKWDVDALGASLYVDKIATTAKDALKIILEERRKELVLRGLRWTDIKRLNLEGYNINLKRVLDGVEYLLPANDNRYALPIPPDEIALSGIEQNLR